VHDTSAANANSAVHPERGVLQKVVRLNRAARALSPQERRHVAVAANNHT
jgi:hypothetical protein